MMEGLTERCIVGVDPYFGGDCLRNELEGYNRRRISRALRGDDVEWPDIASLNGS